jgi:hypothetical protein
MILLMSRLAWMAVGAAIALGACAYPDFVFNGSTGTGGTTATTGHGASTTTTTTGTGGSMCVVKHPGGGSCEYLPGQECGCSDPSQKCSVIDPTSGESTCVTAGTTADDDTCTSTTDCMAGSWCELSTSVCEPICSGTSSCASGTCVEAAQSDQGTATIPGLDVCSVTCDLVSGSPCGASATCVTVMTSTGTTTTECAKSGDVQLGDPCSTTQDCAAGGVCTEDPVTSTANCSQWCRDGEDPCPAMGETCHNFTSPSVTVGGHDYGYCGL